MDFRDKDFFDRLMMLTEENNKLLRKMHRSAQLAMVWKLIYWIIIIGISIGAYYYIQPYLDPLLKTFMTLQRDLGTINSAMSPFSKR